MFPERSRARGRTACGLRVGRGPLRRGHASRGRSGCFSVASRSARRDQRASCPGRSHLPRRRSRRHLHWLSWVGCKRIAAGAIANKRQVAAKRLMRITRTIKDGVPKPKNFSVPMPPRGGATLSNSDVTAVAAYVLGDQPSERKVSRAAYSQKGDTERRFRNHMDGWLWP